MSNGHAKGKKPTKNAEYKKYLRTLAEELKERRQLNKKQAREFIMLFVRIRRLENKQSSRK
jgi:hypothetical protein